MFDRGIYSDDLKAFLERWTYPLGRPRVSSIGAGSVYLHFPLQGADIVATENYWHMAQSLKLGGDAEPPPSFAALLADSGEVGRAFRMMSAT